MPFLKFNKTKYKWFYIINSRVLDGFLELRAKDLNLELVTSTIARLGCVSKNSGWGAGAYTGECAPPCKVQNSMRPPGQNPVNAPDYSFTHRHHHTKLKILHIVYEKAFFKRCVIKNVTQLLYLSGHHVESCLLQVGWMEPRWDSPLSTTYSTPPSKHLPSHRGWYSAPSRDSGSAPSRPQGVRLRG